MTLGEYLSAGRLKPWEWRRHDCTAFPAIWAGMGDALPPYSREAEAEAMLHEAGGLVPLWSQVVAALPDAAEEIAPHSRQPGDVGVIELPAERNEVDPETGETVTIIDIVEAGAIWTGKRWAFVPRAGGVAAVSDAVCIKAWRPLCRKP